MINLKAGSNLLKQKCNYNIIKSVSLKASSYNEAISEAEKLVGYPTSFLNLRCLLNDEVADIASHIRKLMGTGHPLINTAKNLIMKKDELPNWGLIVLLISKCGKSNCDKMFSRDISEDILPQQRTLAEVTEMVRTSNILHNSILNIDKTNLIDNINYGNKLALLSGDYLLSTSFKLLAEMRNQEVNELISTALRDLNESNFIKPRNSQNMAFPAQPASKKCDIEVPVELSSSPYNINKYLGHAKSEWILRSLLNGVTLLAKACEGSMILSGNEKYRENAHYFGRNMGLAYHACLELKLFAEENQEFPLTSAPVLFHIQHEPSFYKELTKNVDLIDYKKIKLVIKNGPGIQETLTLKKEFCNKALEVLQSFPEGNARNVLMNIIETM